MQLTTDTRHWQDLGIAPQQVPEDLADQLQHFGYCIFHNKLTLDACRHIGARIDELVEHEGPLAAQEHHQEAGCHRLANLVNKDACFDQIWTDSEILSAMALAFGRPFRISSLNAREALPGGGHQALHEDWKSPRADPQRVEVMNALWAIDDLGPDNGGPRLVPATHQHAEQAHRLLTDAEAAHPNEIIPHIPAGSVLLLNAHCWHGGTTNRNGARRRIVHSYFTARDQPQQQVQSQLIDATSRERLSPAQCWLLDI